LLILLLWNSKSEFVVYKLKEMGKIQENDVVEICQQFDYIDKLDAGKITLAQLLEAETDERGKSS
jgi:potassium channel subfamily K